MQRKSKAIVFLGMTYPYGTIRHFALLGCELYNVCRSEFDFYFASIAREPNKGSWDIVRITIPENHVIKTSTFEELVSRSVMLAKSYDKVLIHTGGGWGQTKHFVKARKKMEQRLAKRIILVGTTHSYRNDSWMRVPMSMFQYALYRLHYKMIVFQCQYAADRFVGGNHLIQLGKGVVVPLGCEPFVDCDVDIPQGIASNNVLSKVLVDKTLFKFVYLAAFRPGKMHVWLVHALAPVLRNHSDGRLLFCGEGDEHIRIGVIKAIEDEKLGNQVLLTGQIARHEVPWLLKHSNCAVVPSRAETFGHNFLEPMFAGLPVLGTAVGIGRDVIKDGMTGYVFELRNPEQLRKEAERILSDIKAANEMGERAKKLVGGSFTHHAVAKKLVEVYKSLLA